VTVVSGRLEAEFRALTRGRLPHWGAGVAFPEEGRVLLRPFPGLADELPRTARHEIAHIVLHRRIRSPAPVWFHEGVAMWLRASGGWPTAPTCSSRC